MTALCCQRYGASHAPALAVTDCLSAPSPLFGLLDAAGVPEFPETCDYCGEEKDGEPYASKHTRKADPGTKLVPVSPELFERLVAMRLFYGDVDVAHMLDRITENPAAAMPGYTEYPTPESGHCD